MRLSVVLGFAACFLLPVQSQAAWGIFQSYVILDSGSGDQYLAGGINADGASAFAGTDLGDFTAADALTLNGGELKTYKNGSSNVCGGTLNYRVYASGETPGAFTALGLPFSANLSGSDQKWATTGQAIDLLDALIAGDYVLELYWEADGNNSNPSGCGQTQYVNDSGNNFTATFSVLSTGVCPSSVNFDGYDYETVQIGEQCWFAENLRTTVYADGTAIPEVTASGAWTGLSTGARCNYDNDAINALIYGRLYNWYAVNNGSGLCPSGWHVPTDEEWTALKTYLGANGHSGAEGTALKSTSGWNITGGGTDNYGFSALPGGFRHDYYGSFDHAGYDGWWWSSSPYGGSAWVRNLAFNLPHIFRTSGGDPRSGVSVRCLRDADQTEPQGCTDPGYIEYDASATTDDGSCATLVVEGCTDSGYTEYDPSANVDDGSCATLVVEGCTDSDYTEYDPSANVDDGSCATLVVEGCTDANYTEYEASANTDDGSCATLVVEGCTDANYTEYDASANTDDGSCATLLGCTNSDMASMDGYNYGLTTIGDQCWFAENLRTTLYADGSAIPELTDHAEWAATSTGARCDYDNVPLNVATYGRLYNWHAATDASGLCPSGWHVPTDGEWTGLEDYITSQGFDGTEGTALKSTSGWSAGNGTDDFGFAALPGGRRNNGNFDSFTGIGSIGRWWSSSPDGSDAWSRNMNQNPGISRGSTDPGKGFSIRCLRNADHIESQGCTDPAYLEFDASANVDDNSCATLVVEGCTDPAYTEYDASANTDDGSCATLVVEGCMDPSACNYDDTATIDDGSCESLSCAGCMDPSACNYDDTATIDDGSCESLSCAGCMDPSACNYDNTATIDDASCESLSCAGCMDPSACNYDDTATIPDGSCESLSCAGCMDPSACNYDDTATIDDGSCESLSCAGCMDPSACNYDDTATIDDGSCESLSCAGCMDPSACNYDDTATIPDASCESLSCAGCMDPSACNYNDTATIPDGSCESLSCAGCTNPAYTEYDASATIDDGSCQTLADPCITAITPSFDLDFGQPDNDLSTGDDEYSTVALPFTFDFSGTAYSSVTISSNGVLNFGPSGMEDTEPLALQDYEADIILGAHHDLNPSTSASSLISYGVNGTAPNRAFVASWRGIPSYSDNNLLHNFQIVLYESGNVIEIWNGGHPYIPFGYITIGIAREDGTGIGPFNYNDEALAAGKWSFTPDGSGGHVQAQSSNSALSLESIVTETPATTVDGTDGQATLLVNSGDPTSLTLTGINGAGDYSFAQPGSIDGVAPGLYSVTATDANGCTSNALTLIMTYALCCDCGVSDSDSDGICDDVDNCTDKTATNYADPANDACSY